MGLFDFIKDAGEKIFGSSDDKPEVKEAADEAYAAHNETQGDSLAADEPMPVEPIPAVDHGTFLASYELKDHVNSLGLQIEELNIQVAGDRVIVGGNVPDQETAEKIILALGNVDGVAQVESNLNVSMASNEATFHTVEKGEYLSKIAKKHYGDAMKYNLIFEANKPMLKHPDKIYPGQVLRIPPLA